MKFRARRHRVKSAGFKNSLGHLKLEPLESRRMLAIDVTLAGGLLSIQDNSAEPNELSIDLASNGAQIEIIDSAGISPDGNQFFFDGGNVVRYLVNGINEVRVKTSERADLITIAGTAASFTTSIDTGPNDDRIQVAGNGGSLDDLSGNTSIVGGEGSDSLVIGDNGDRDNNQFEVTPSGVSRNAASSLIAYSSIEQLRLVGGAGADVFHVSPSTSMEMEFDGAEPSNVLPGDELHFDLTDVDAPSIAGDARQGMLVSASHQEVRFSQMETLTSNATLEGDRFEPNESTESATILGSLPAITLRDLNIHSSSDVDVFRITANQTGWTIVNVFFDHGMGDIDVRIRDELGNIVRRSESNNDNERLGFSVVSERFYYVEVYGFEGATNQYALDIENFEVPFPTAVVLDPNSETGAGGNDGITHNENARVIIQTDLFEIQEFGTPILDPEAAEAGETGVAVQVFANGQSVGFAEKLIGAEFFSFTFDNGQLADGIPVGRPGAADVGGFMNLVTATVTVFDAQKSPFARNTRQSPPLVLTYDPNAPIASEVTVDLLPSSNSGGSADGATNISQPAVGGVAEAGARIRVLANGRVVGEGLVGSDSSNGTVGDGLGIWEVTVEPLIDGQYVITAQVEDAAGNVTTADADLAIVVDTTAPQRPTLDLVGPDVVSADNLGIPPFNSDTGISGTDNTTRGFEFDTDAGTADIQISITAEPTAIVRVKNGQDVVDTFVMSTPPPGDPLARVFRRLTLAEGTHPLSVEVIDTVFNRSAQSDELLVTVDVTAPSAHDAPDLIQASDTGVDFEDNVTRIAAPTFSGVAEAGLQVRLAANQIGDTFTQPIGTTITRSDESDGSIVDGQLAPWEINSIPLDDGSYAISVLLEDLAGNISQPSPALQIEIDTLAPNTPLLDLVESNDSGRSNEDNVTSFASPILSATSHDPNSDDHREADNLVFRVFDRADSDAEALIYDSFDTLGGLTQLSRIVSTANGVDGDSVIGTLIDGTHNLKLEVEDRAGNISADFHLPVVIDTEAFLGFGRLHPDSDTGVPGYADTSEDRITSDRTPTFYGTAEANSLVTVTIDGAKAGTAVALPEDGNRAFQPQDAPNTEFQGTWVIPTVQNLNDGVRRVVFTFEDVAGNRVERERILIFVDTQGPNVSNVTLGDVSSNGHFALDDNATSLFAPKPSGGPDPLIRSLVVHFQDAPARTSAFSYEALFSRLASEEGNYRLVGDASGDITILDAIPTFATTAGEVASASVELIVHDPVNQNLFDGDDLGAPLPDDRFTLTVSDRLLDPAGNALDGQSGSTAPFVGNDMPEPARPWLPSGDGSAGGDFVARFTVDSRPELGVWAAGSVWTDTNGNGIFDASNGDHSNRDIVYTVAQPSDDVFAGDFSASENSSSDGFDKLAAYGLVGDSHRWLIDTDNDGVADIVQIDPANVNGLPVAGRFDGDETNGDEVALFTGSTWHFDTDHDFQVDAILPSHLMGYPIVGDFDGDGFDDLGTWTDNRFQIDLAHAVQRGWDGIADATFRFGFSGVRERPVATDMDQDGFDDLGLWVPDRAGPSESNRGEWYWLISGGFSVLERIVTNPDLDQDQIPFTPVPFGNDVYEEFGDPFALPVVGNFDPPLANGQVLDPPGTTRDPLDVSGDGTITPLDALLVINQLESDSSYLPLPEHEPDVNLDGLVTPFDALLIINWLDEQADSLATDVANNDTQEKSALPRAALAAPAGGEANIEDESSVSEHNGQPVLQQSVHDSGQTVKSRIDGELLDALLRDGVPAAKPPVEVILTDIVDDIVQLRRC